MLSAPSTQLLKRRPWAGARDESRGIQPACQPPRAPRATTTGSAGGKPPSENHIARRRRELQAFESSDSDAAIVSSARWTSYSPSPLPACSFGDPTAHCSPSPLVVQPTKDPNLRFTNTSSNDINVRITHNCSFGTYYRYLALMYSEA